MTHDESVYPEPFAFKPERFFDGNGKLNDENKLLMYGFGRRYFLSFTIINLFSQQCRACAGEHVASATVGVHHIFSVPI
jgi:cytochrome P450